MALRGPEAPGKPVLHFSSICRGTLVSLGLSLFFSTLAGLGYYFTSLSENTMPWASAIILFLSVAAGGAYAAKKAGTKGLFNGLGVGVTTFFIIWLLVGFFLPSQVLFMGALGKLVLTTVAGSLGGTLGVGLAS